MVILAGSHTLLAPALDSVQAQQELVGRGIAVTDSGAVEEGVPSSVAQGGVVVQVGHVVQDPVEDDFRSFLFRHAIMQGTVIDEALIDLFGLCVGLGALQLHGLRIPSSIFGIEVEFDGPTTSFLDGREGNLPEVVEVLRVPVGVGVHSLGQEVCDKCLIIALVGDGVGDSDSGEVVPGGIIEHLVERFCGEGILRQLTGQGIEKLLIRVGDDGCLSTVRRGKREGGNCQRKGQRQDEGEICHEGNELFHDVRPPYVWVPE